ncbi:MAG: hypothetical protein U0736_01410 [Gemmataceae bacterium]
MRHPVRWAVAAALLGLGLVTVVLAYGRGGARAGGARVSGPRGGVAAGGYRSAAAVGPYGGSAAGARSAGTVVGPAGRSAGYRAGGGTVNTRAGARFSMAGPPPGGPGRQVERPAATSAECR